MAMKLFKKVMGHFVPKTPYQKECEAEMTGRESTVLLAIQKGSVELYRSVDQLGFNVHQYARETLAFRPGKESAVCFSFDLDIL